MEEGKNLQPDNNYNPMSDLNNNQSNENNQDFIQNDNLSFCQKDVQSDNAYSGQISSLNYGQNMEQGNNPNMNLNQCSQSSYNQNYNQSNSQSCNQNYNQSNSQVYNQNYNQSNNFNDNQYINKSTNYNQTNNQMNNGNYNTGYNPNNNQYQNNGQNNNQWYSKVFNQNQTFDPMDIEKNKVMAGLAYLLFFIPLIACPQSRFGRFHANQGLLLLLLAFVGGLIFGIIPFIGWALSVIYSMVMFVIMIVCLINGINGKAYELPIIGKLRIIK